MSLESLIPKSQTLGNRSRDLGYYEPDGTYIILQEENGPSKKLNDPDGILINLGWANWTGHMIHQFDQNENFINAIVITQAVADEPDPLYAHSANKVGLVDPLLMEKLFKPLDFHGKRITYTEQIADIMGGAYYCLKPWAVSKRTLQKEVTEEKYPEHLVLNLRPDFKPEKYGFTQILTLESNCWAIVTHNNYRAEHHVKALTSIGFVQRPEGYILDAKPTRYTYKKGVDELSRILRLWRQQSMSLTNPYSGGGINPE